LIQIRSEGIKNLGCSTFSYYSNHSTFPMLILGLGADNGR
jgi:hypothetical protein